ncbi:hypothetical protein [Lysobacter sp. TAB13]|uniref:hypothetical protein n=1 Tax=Lysobacter sp. TAB13 TaxID=3233065 RepID=UPI003F9B559C
MIAGDVRVGIAPDGAYASMSLCLVVTAPRDGGDAAASRGGARELHFYDKNRQNLHTCRYDGIHAIAASRAPACAIARRRSAPGRNKSEASV